MMFHAGTCPQCEQGVRGFRTCGQQPLLMCDECEAVWASPESDQVFLPPQPDLPSPLTGKSLLGPDAHWCERPEVDAAGWSDAIEGEVQTSEAGGGIDPLPVYVGSPACPMSPALDVCRAAMADDSRLEVLGPGDDSTRAEAVVLDGEPPRMTGEIEVALASQKHVIASLPWGDLAAVRELVSQAEEQRRTLAANVAWAAHPRTTAIRTCIDDGQIGLVQRVIIGRSENDSRGLESLLVEAILVTKWIADMNPMSGSATALSADAAILTLEFESMIALLDISDNLPKRQWIEIVGTSGSIVCDDFFEPKNDVETRYWIHGSDGQSETRVTPPASGVREALLRVFRQARMGDFDSGESVADATEIATRLLESDPHASDGQANRGDDDLV